MGWWTMHFGANTLVSRMTQLRKHGSNLSWDELVAQTDATMAKIRTVGEQAVPALALGVEDTDDDYRQQSCDILRALDTVGNGENFFVKSLGSRESYVRFYAAKGLAGLARTLGERSHRVALIERVVPILLNLTFGDANGRVQNAAGTAILSMGQDVIPSLVKCLTNSNPKMRTAAVITLSKIGTVTDETLTRLSDTARSDLNATVRGTAQKAIEIIRARQAG